MGEELSLFNSCMDGKYIGDLISLNILCYPNYKKCNIYNRLDQAELLGIEKICNFGDYLIFSNKYNKFHILGKGHSSMVFLGYVKKLGLKAIKVRRTDSKRIKLIDEGKILEKLSKYGITPKVYGYSNDFLIMDYVGRINLKYIIQKENKLGILNYVIEGLQSAKIMDYTGIIHNELNRPWKNVYYPSYPRAFPALIIDLESYSTGCGNVNKYVGGIIGKLNLIKYSVNLQKLLYRYKAKNCDPLMFNYLRKELIRIINISFI
jgi:putative serine/threonine protein kinase